MSVHDLSTGARARRRLKAQHEPVPLALACVLVGFSAGVPCGMALLAWLRFLERAS